MDPTAGIRELHEGLQERAFSARELLASCRQAIAAHDGTLNAFLALNQEGADAAAAAVDQRLARGETLPPLAGIPLAVKDVIVTRDLPTTAGSKILDGYRAPYDATVIEKLKEQSAIIIGKTNCDEFAMGASGEYSAYGPTRNPWDATRVPGGSSSGSAAAVAAGFSVASLGSDTGGSVRQPASFCNLVGLKPTYGRVSRYGLIALASSLDQIGVMARTAEDAAYLLEAISGHDPDDATSAREPVPSYPALLDETVRGMTIGVPRRFLAEGLSDEAAARFADVEAALRSLGCTVAEVDLPHADAALPAYYVILPVEAAANLARYDGVRFAPILPPHRQRRGPARGGDATASFDAAIAAHRAARFGDEVKRRIMLGAFASSRGYQERFYRQAAKVRTLIRQEFFATLTDVHALLLPTAPEVAFRLGAKTADPLALYLSDLFTVPANLAGLPALSFPAGFVEASGAPPVRLPFGAQLIGRRFGEGDLLRLAHAYQRVTDWHTQKPPLS